MKEISCAKCDKVAEAIMYDGDDEDLERGVHLCKDHFIEAWFAEEEDDETKGEELNDDDWNEDQG